MSRLRHAAIAAVFAAVCLSSSHAAAPSVGPPAIKDFVRQSDFTGVTISPDGRYIAALVPNLGDPHENVLTILDGRTARVLKAIPSGHRAMVSHYFWGDDDRLFAELAVRWNGLDTPSATGELFAIDPDGQNQIELFGIRAPGKYSTRASAALLSSHYVAPGEILISTHDFVRDSAGAPTDIVRINVRTAHRSSVGTSPELNARLMADNDGQVRVAYADNDYKGEHLWLRKDNDSSWEKVNDPLQSHVAIQPIGFNRDNSKLYVRVTHGNESDAIELMDMQSHQRTRLYQGKFADPGALLRTADDRDYYAVITQEGQPGLHYFDDDAMEAQLGAALAKSFPGQFAYASSFTRDGKRAIVRVESDRNPGDYYLFDLATRNMQLLAHARPWVNPDAMRPMLPFDMQARDGLSLHGFLTLPAGPKPYPLVVLPHGGPHGIADRWAYDSEVQLLASRGYAVLQVNYRGSGGYGNHFLKIGYRQWGLSMQDDVTDATHWAVAQGYADANRVCIYGASYGGYAALEGAVREPDLYKCAVGYAGVYDLRVQVDKSDTHRSDAGQSYLDVALGTDRDDLLKRSPLSGADKIKADVLLMHGGEDARVPIDNFYEFTRALKRNHKHFETLVEDHEGHGFFVPDHQEEAYEHLLAFLSRNIGAGMATAPDATPAPSTATGTH